MVTNGKQSVPEWYKGKSVFITGGSGFMGKVLVEKLLYSCPGIDKLYILLRSKRGRTSNQRVEDMWSLPMFQRLRKSQPNAIKKIETVQGDVISEELGLSASDRQLIMDNVSVVFHCAATLKLEANLKDAIEMNTAGTEKVLDLAKQIKNLKAFIHLSTAFCSVDIDVFEEKVYECPDNPRDVIQCAKWMKLDAIEMVTPSVIAPHPNTYTYSKRLAESLVASEHKNIPVAIIRPAIVTPASKEPLPGWVDSLNGPMGLLVGAGKGVIRSMHCKVENRGQVVPVDIAINGIITAAWKLGSATYRPKEVPVYNMTNDGVISQTWGDVMNKGRKIVHDNPFEMQIWYPDGDFRSSKLVHQICCIFMHWLPAYFIDFMMLIFRQKLFMVRLQGKIHQGLELLQFFTTREWVFKSEKFLGLTDDLSPEDRATFPMDFTAMPIEEYLTVCVLGARQYCMKEDLSSLPRCRLKQKFLYVIDRLFALAFYGGIIWMLYSYSNTVKTGLDFVGLYAKKLPVVGNLIPTN